ncbi:aminopeptidase P [Plasmodium brasilianum]|uniref:Aminopeptidase P, putative n=2 Tax=Plasmodium (Plasmodium) TaxID=418103 RepID=A0A1D3SQ62_PLAMA|nr:aminopeptidase P, putative [Plasmodium malariae]KAI4836741.1 aminopeptidase P [Plasmodium brasilianum]SCO94029.1 aminopeptidase P, putative [Plasmodium malariae]
MVFHLNFLYKGNRINYVSACINVIRNFSSSKANSINNIINTNGTSSAGCTNSTNSTNSANSANSTNNFSNDFNNRDNNFDLSNQEKISGNFFKQKFRKIIEQSNKYLSEEKKDHTGEELYTMNSSSNNDNTMMKPYMERLNELKKIMKEKKIDMYILINNDEHNSEIINDKDKKIYYLSNYSGADGILIITQEQNILYVNTLYELQAQNEIDHSVFTLKISRITNKEEIFETISSLKFNNVAFDGKCTSVSFYEKLKTKVEDTYPDKTIEEKVIYEKDSIDDITNRDNLINFLILEKSLVEIKIPHDTGDKSIYIHERKFNGACAGEKIEKLRQHFAFDNKVVDKLFISELDEIAYILNLRGYDYKYSPLFYSYLYFEFNRENSDFDKIILFTTSKNLTPGAIRHLNTIHVTVMEYETVVEYLRDNVSSKTKLNKGDSNNDSATSTALTANSNSSVVVTGSQLNSRRNSTEEKTYEISLSPFINLIIYMLFDKEKILLQKSAIVDMKAVKNDVEIDNMKEAHVLDALALLQFFHWCDEKRKTKELFNETEISLKNQIDHFRSTKQNFLFPSFTTISAIGSNAAVIHYECTEATNTKISPSIYLLDSGGQYLHGTTDVTRTTHFGEPTAEEKRIYTLVLKGHLHLRKVIFTNYTNSMALDFLARENLFKHYFDYNHGTGHGVGLFLNVHEGGCSISPAAGTPLKPSMVLSNEPGYYMENKFGVRIENMQYVISKKRTDNNLEFLSFEDLTLYPYEKKLLDFSILTTDEIRDINEYHETIRKTLMPILKKNPTVYGQAIEKYLIEITDPIKIN